jgi:hypothetical protein
MNKKLICKKSLVAMAAGAASLAWMAVPAHASILADWTLSTGFGSDTGNSGSVFTSSVGGYTATLQGSGAAQGASGLSLDGNEYLTTNLPINSIQPSSGASYTIQVLAAFPSIPADNSGNLPYQAMLGTSTTAAWFMGFDNSTAKVGSPGSDGMPLIEGEDIRGDLTSGVLYNFSILQTTNYEEIFYNGQRDTGINTNATTFAAGSFWFQDSNNDNLEIGARDGGIGFQGTIERIVISTSDASSGGDAGTVANGYNGSWINGPGLASVPEPGTYAAVVSGLGMLLGLQKFRSRKA